MGPRFPDDGARLRWIRDEYLARVEKAPAWVSRGLILRRVAATAFGIDQEVLRAPIRFKPIANARQQTMTLASIVCGWSSERIGHIFNRDHATVLHALEKYHALVAGALEGPDESNLTTAPEARQL